jgi:hypothetical protein
MDDSKTDPVAVGTNNKLNLIKSDRAFREIATDSAVSGPTPDGIYHLTLIADNVDIVSQTLVAIDPNDHDKGFSLGFSPDDTVISRLVLGQVLLPEKAFWGLYTAMTGRAVGAGQIDIAKQIIKDHEEKNADIKDD